MAKDYFLHPEFLKALIILECDGAAEVPARYEAGIYEQLKEVKDSSGLRFENITHDMIKDTPDSLLKEMSKSYGAFQLMGYKSAWLGISLEELKARSTFWGIYWIDKTYGDYVRDSSYKHAFHLHNAGKPYPDSGPPLTYNPNYVKNGLKHLEVFRKMEIAKRRRKKNQIKIKPGKVIKKKEERLSE